MTAAATKRSVLSERLRQLSFDSELLTVYLRLGLPVSTVGDETLSRLTQGKEALFDAHRFTEFFAESEIENSASDWEGVASTRLQPLRKEILRILRTQKQREYEPLVQSVLK